MVQARQQTNLKIQAPTAKTVKQSTPRYILELQNIDLKECAREPISCFLCYSYTIRKLEDTDIGVAAASNTMMLIILVKRNGLHEEQ